MDRADISAEVHGWYWEVIFDNLDADIEELIPPLRGGPYVPAGTVAGPSPEKSKFLVITVDTQTGNVHGGAEGKTPRPGPYITASQAIQIARHGAAAFPRESPEGLRPPDVSWAEDPNVEAYLRGDTWIVLFGLSGPADSRWVARVDAVTGEWKGMTRNGEGLRVPLSSI